MVHDEAQRRVTQAQDGFLRKSRGLLLCGILLATTVGCGVSRPHPTLAELKRTPGAELTYPGSMPELAGQADSNRKFGVNPAFFGERGFTNASSSEVFAFFDRMLQQEGWTRDDSKVRGLTTWAEFHAYARGARAFAVAVVAADERARLSRMDARYATYRTVYETLIT